MSRLDKVVHVSLITMLMGAMVFAYFEQAANGSTVQIGIAILLSFVTIGGSAAVAVIIRSLTTLGKKVDDINDKVTRLEEGQKDVVRRVDSIEVMERTRGDKCSSHETRISVIESKLEGME